MFTFFVDPAAPVDKQVGAIPEGEEFPKTVGGIQKSEPPVLGSSHVGERLLCGEFGQCDG